MGKTAVKVLGPVVLILWASAAWAEEPRPVSLSAVVWATEGPPPAELKAWWSGVRDALGRETDVSWAATGGDPVTVTLSGRPGAWSALVQRPSSSGSKYLTFARPDADAALELTRLAGALVRRPSPLRPGPQIVDRFELAGLQGVDLPVAASLLYPSSLASGAGGNLLVASGSAVLELDRRWMVVGQPAKDLGDRGLLNFAWGVSLTPAGTLFVRSADGASLWSLPPGGGVRKWPGDPSSAGLPSGVLSDGRPFAVVSAPPAVRIWSAQGPVLWPLPAEGAVTAAAPGPGGTLWLADAVRGVIRVLSPEGTLADVVAPDLPAGTVIQRLRVGAGGFWAVTNRDLRRFASDGSLVWVWDGEGGGLPSLADLQPGTDGLLYLSDFGGKAVYRLTEAPEALPPDLRAVGQAYRRTTEPGAGPETWKALALVYLDQGAVEAALTALDRYLADRPADAGAQDLRRTARVTLGKTRAADAAADALAQLKAYGPETGGDAYRRAMKAYEALRASAPGDPEVTGPMQALRQAFAAAETAPVLPVPRVGRTELGPLFPSLLQGYRSRPAGFVQLTNTTGEPMADLRAEVSLARFTDLPAAGAPVASLAPGAEARLDLFVPLNDRVFDLEEDLPVQAAVTLRWTDRRGDRSLETVVPVTLYRRTALTWDQTGKLAAFITPNEETVSRTAFELLPEPSPTPVGGPTVARAAALADGLGSLPLRYVPDPVVPFEAVRSATGAVDTVRFPRNTLAYRGGDCDDTTALLASVLEAAGLPTALVTTPGHVFLAFDTGEPATAAWLYTAAGRRPLVREGHLWIPLETTVLSNGFEAAWKAASALADRHEGTPDFEFLPVAGLRGLYPPLPLPPTPGAGPRWDKPALAAFRSAAELRLASAFLPALTADLEAQAASGTESRWLSASNRLARAQAVWGRPDLAEATLRALVARSPRWTPAYLNLAALRLAHGDGDGARTWLAAGRSAADPGAVAEWAARAGLEASLTPGPVVAGQGPGGRAAGAVLPPWSGD